MKIVIFAKIEIAMPFSPANAGEKVPKADEGGSLVPRNLVAHQR